MASGGTAGREAMDQATSFRLVDVYVLQFAGLRDLLTQNMLTPESRSHGSHSRPRVERLLTFENCVAEQMAIDLYTSGTVYVRLRDLLVGFAGPEILRCILALKTIEKS